MLNKLYIYGGIFIAAVLAFLGIKAKAKSDGKAEAKQEQINEVIENVKEAKQVKDSVAKLPDTDVRDKLRKRAKRQ